MADSKSIDLIFRRIKEGDRLTFQQFFETHYKEMVNYCYKITRNEVISEEVVQEIFINLWERREIIELKSALTSYLYSAIKKRSINYLKNELPKQQSQVDTETLEGMQDTAASLDDTDDTDKLEEFITNAVNNLPEKCREIFILSRYAGLTYQEIADELEISTKTVENQITIALRKLRISLEPIMKARNY
jgi:RNA polymerase sigma-70 factor (ECF subfamily)